jgi:thiamine biosynthesis protein ThiS
MLPRDPTVRLTVNGRPLDLPDGATVGGLLRVLEIDRERIAVERNHDVVPRATYDDAALADGDRLEVVGFIGGG